MIKETTINNTISKRFGRLIAMEYVYSKNGRDYWKCLCDCGKEIILMGKHLRNGNTKSCGCLNIDTVKERSRANFKIGLLCMTNPKKLQSY